MRMAACPKCKEHNVNGFKKHDKWYSKCYNCGFTTEVGQYSRKNSRYNWNLLYEKMTGETLPDECCGRQPRAYMKKEIQAGIPQLISCFTQEDYEAWQEQHPKEDVAWLLQGKKKKQKNPKELKMKVHGVE